MALPLNAVNYCTMSCYVTSAESPIVQGCFQNDFRNMNAAINQIMAATTNTGYGPGNYSLRLSPCKITFTMSKTFKEIVEVTTKGSPISIYAVLTQLNGDKFWHPTKPIAQLPWNPSLADGAGSVDDTYLWKNGNVGVGDFYDVAAGQWGNPNMFVNNPGTGDRKIHFIDLYIEGKIAVFNPYTSVVEAKDVLFNYQRFDPTTTVDVNVPQSISFDLPNWAGNMGWLQMIYSFGCRNAKDFYDKSTAWPGSPVIPADKVLAASMLDPRYSVYLGPFNNIDTPPSIALQLLSDSMDIVYIGNAAADTILWYGTFMPSSGIVSTEYRVDFLDQGSRGMQGNGFKNVWNMRWLTGDGGEALGFMAGYDYTIDLRVQAATG